MTPGGIKLLSHHRDLLLLHVQIRKLCSSRGLWTEDKEDGSERGVDNALVLLFDLDSLLIESRFI